MDAKTFHVKQVSAEGVGEAVIATLNVVDKENDVIRPGAFGTQHIAVLPAHDASGVPLGKAVVSEDGNEAKAAFTLNTETQAGKEWASHLARDLKDGNPIQQWSFSYLVRKESFGAFGDKAKVRFLEELEVSEVSPVLVGAGINTRTIAAKAASDEEEAAARKAEQEKEAAERLAALAAEQSITRYILNRSQHDARTR